MPAATTLSRISKHEYFAILGSGTCVVGGWSLLLASYWSYRHDRTAWESLKEFSGIIQNHWPVAVAILYLAFLVGSVLRAIRVNSVENLYYKGRNFLTDELPKKIRQLEIDEDPNPKSDPAKQEGPETKAAQDIFPYVEQLKTDLRVFELRLGVNLAEEKKMLGNGDPTHSLFHFWKAELCREVPTAFEYVQEWEGRVRLFATMVWAAALNIVAGTIGIAFWAYYLHDYAWGVIMFSLLIGSAMIFLVFGSQLRHIRKQEVANVFIAYLSLTMERGEK